MLLLIQLALRNLIRNPLRTLLNLSMIVGAFSAIVVFKGFSHYSLDSLEEGQTKGLSGHLQVAKISMWDGEPLKEKKEAYIDASSDLKNRLLQLPQIETVGERINAYVLLSNNNQSMGANAIGFDPKVEPYVEKANILVEGEGFSGKNDYEVLIGAGIQKQMKLKMGQTLTIVSQTLQGSMSSIEPEVRGIFSTGLTDVDSTLIYLSVPAVQKLLDTNRMEREAILLKPGANLAQTMAQVKTILPAESKLEVKSWSETNLLYQQLVDFYATQNFLVEAILAILAFLGILNSVGMSIYERIGEIGTMQALGDQRSEVLGLFMLEGLLLGLVGAAIGVIAAYGLSTGLSSLGVTAQLPGQSQPFVILVTPALLDYLEASLLVCCICVFSTLWPAQKAVRMVITDALRANS